MKRIADVLGVARSHFHKPVRWPAAPAHSYYCKSTDEDSPAADPPASRRAAHLRRLTALVNTCWQQKANRGPTTNASSASSSATDSYFSGTHAAAERNPLTLSRPSRKVYAVSKSLAPL
jgi:hypothetical protein